MGAKTEDINVFDYLKDKYHYILLLIFLIFGFSIRYYHIDYPIVGYHNWKSTHYITEARNFAQEGFFKEGFFVPMRATMNNVNEDPSGAHNDTFPTISIIIGFLFKLFGESLVVARAVNILLSMLSVIVFYLLIRELFNRESIALLCAFLAAINPLYVFFSHNIQVVNPGLFLMLLGFYFYVKWLKTEKLNNLYLGAFFSVFAIITKYTFAVMIFPILFSFPYKRILKDKKKFITPLLICLLIASIFPAWLFYSEYVVRPRLLGEQATATKYSLTSLVQVGIVSDKAFWQTIKSYVADNYTLFGTMLAIIGSILFVLLYLKNQSKLSYKFMLGYLIGLFVFIFVMGFKLSGHNYHQFPITPLILFLIAYFMDVVAKNLSNFIKEKNLKLSVYIVVICLLLLLPLSKGKSLMNHSKESRDRMFNTQFPGLNIAGDYIKEHSEPNDRVFHSSHQSVGVLWHADKIGYKPPSNLSLFKKGESLDASWVFVYQWGMQNYFQNPELFDYIKQNYRLVQAAFVPPNQPIYFLLRKGGTFDDTKLNEMLQNKPGFTYTYEYTHQPYQITYINLE